MRPTSRADMGRGHSIFIPQGSPLKPECHPWASSAIVFQPHSHGREGLINGLGLDWYHEMLLTSMVDVVVALFR